MRNRRLSVAASGALFLGVAGLIISASTAAFAAPGDDNTPPVRTLDVGSAGVSLLLGLAISPSGETYVGIDAANGILIYAAGATGTDAPIGSIEGPSTLLSHEYALAFDASGNLWVANETTILEFAAGATGDVAPITVLTGGTLGFGAVEGVTIGPDGRIYTADYATTRVDVFAAGATGSDEPVQQIAGSNTTMVDPDGIVIDSTGAMYIGDFGNNTIEVFAPAATGNVAPARIIGGAATGLSSPYYEAFDAAGNLYAANYTAGTVTMYAAGATGNVAPLRTITGAATQVNGPFPIATSGTELFVGNYNTSMIGVFSIQATNATAVTPNTGSSAGGTTITVTGSGFTLATPTVSVGGAAAAVTVVNDTTLTAVTPAGAVGAADVVVMVPGFNPAVLAAAFTYEAELAATGVDAGPTGLVGAVLLVIGLVLLIVRRRARVGSTTL